MGISFPAKTLTKKSFKFSDYDISLYLTIMRNFILVFSLNLVLSISLLSAQSLKPGFYKTECLTMLEISARFGDSAYASRFPEPTGYKMLYRSKVVGMDNLWELWMND